MQKQLVNSSKIKLSSCSVSSNTVPKRLKHSLISTLNISSNGQLQSQKRIRTKRNRHRQVNNMRSSTLCISENVQQPKSIRKLNIRERSKKTNKRRDKGFRSLNEASAITQHPSCSALKNDPTEMKPNTERHQQLGRLSVNPRYGNIHHSRAKAEYDRLEAVITAQNLVIETQTKNITELTQDLFTANEKIQQLETCISENH